MSTAAVKAGEQAAKRTLCLLAPSLLAILVAKKQIKQYREHEQEMERIRGLLAAELAAVDDRRERVLVLAPELAASLGAKPAGCAKLAEELGALDKIPLSSLEQEIVQRKSETSVPAVKVAIW